jgi:ATP-dependent helicase YprA (DUF1998 family)
MNLREQWEGLVEETGGALPAQLKQFQVDTFQLIESGDKHVLVSVPTGQGKTLMMVNAARLLGGESE